MSVVNGHLINRDKAYISRAPSVWLSSENPPCYRNAKRLVVEIFSLYYYKNIIEYVSAAKYESLVMLLRVY